MELAKFTILGVPRVKKNTQRAVIAVNRKTGKPYPKIVMTPAYKAWQKSAIPQINRQKPSYTIDSPVNLKCLFYMDTEVKVDLSALYEGIQDELVSAKVLSDDNYTIVQSHDGSGVYIDRNKPRMEIIISEAIDRVKHPNYYVCYGGLTPEEII